MKDNMLNNKNNENNNISRIHACDLHLEENDIFKNVKCTNFKFYSKKKEEEIEKINSKEILDGILKLSNNSNFFEFSYDGFICEFNIEDEGLKRELKNKLSNPRIKNLSNFNTILSENSSEYLGYIDIYFFNTFVNENLEIVLDDLSILNDFCTVLTDGISNFFAYNMEDKIINIFSNNKYIVCEIMEGYLKFKELIEEKEYVKQKYHMFLSRGVVTFKDTAEFKSSKIISILNDKDNYFSIWEQYSKIQASIILKRAQIIGYFTYKKSGDVLIINEDNVLLELKEGDYLEFSNEIPEHLENLIDNWEDYRLLKEKKIRNSEKYKIKRIDTNRNCIYLDFEDEVNVNIDHKKAYLSILGDIKQIERREISREKIVNAKAANPNIGLIISGNLNALEIPKVENREEISPVSPLLNNKIFKNPPTIRQREAIKIGLNTPDIAIIQGPPGTGKTTVITAIIERLNEISNKRNNNKGSVLITSYQHDAVKNVIERLRINSLPTRKFGVKDEEDDFDDRIIEDWINEIKIKIKEENISIKYSDDKEMMSKLYFNYVDFPTKKNAIKFLKFVLEIVKNPEIIEEIYEKLEEMNLLKNEDYNEFENIIRNIRTTKLSFDDDGLENNYRLKLYVQNKTDNKIFIKELKDLLELMNEKEITDSYLKKLKEKRDKLLIKINDNKFLKVDTIDEEITQIYNSCLRDIPDSLNELEKTFYNYYNDLNYNKYKIKNIISDYSYVFASTTQQSLAKSICDAKGLEPKNNEESNIKYKTVIVDEAARVNPGDLLIPISQAEEKLILVGDHRQLPHIYDEEIMEYLINKELITEEEKNKLTREIGSTLFELLKEIAEKLEEKDGIKRTITLDKQYRMHRLLGDFVSKNFYEQYKEGFISGLPDECFRQNLYDKPLVWKVLKNKDGKEEKVGVSRIRRCEVKYIVDDIREKINSEEGKKYKFGVISFYSQQVKLIQNELEKYIDEETMKRIRVGSVDAFQGMEFDIIYLSIVRTSDKYKGDPYGFLKSENRLCVALSRQKRVLVVVGDPDIFISKEFEGISDKVQAIKNLYYLCEKEGVFI